MSATINLAETDGIPIFTVSGYFDEDLGKELNVKADPLLVQGKTRLIIDLSKSPVVNSLGVAQLLDLTVRVVEDFAGKLYLVGVAPVVVKVLKLAGVLPQAELVDSLPAAMQQAKS